MICFKIVRGARQARNLQVVDTFKLLDANSNRESDNQASNPHNRTSNRPSFAKAQTLPTHLTLKLQAESPAWSSTVSRTNSTATRVPTLPLPHHQKNSLTLENGILKLTPRKSFVALSDPALITHNDRMSCDVKNDETDDVIQEAAAEEDEAFELRYAQQIYPHLMPKNIWRSSKRFPRSASGGSILV